jgi:hypothetical protein
MSARKRQIRTFSRTPPSGPLARAESAVMDEPVTPGVTTAARVTWMAAGAVVVLLTMAAASIASRVITDATSRACSPDGRVCITRKQAPRVLQVRPVDRLWVPSICTINAARTTPLRSGSQKDPSRRHSTPDQSSYAEQTAPKSPTKPGVVDEVAHRKPRSPDRGMCGRSRGWPERIRLMLGEQHNLPRRARDAWAMRGW